MKKIIIILVMLLGLIFPLNSFAFEMTATPNNVKAKEEFLFDVKIDKKSYLANGHLVFDSGLFEFISCETEGIELEQISDDEYAWIYTDVAKTEGIEDLVFKFKAPSVAQDTDSEIKIKDYIFIDFDENIYEKTEFSKTIHINKRDTWEMPMTGGEGREGYLICGAGIMIVAVGAWGILWRRISE